MRLKGIQCAIGNCRHQPFLRAKQTAGLAGGCNCKIKLLSIGRKQSKMGDVTELKFGIFSF